jgi:hypothetical protein
MAAPAAETTAGAAADTPAESFDLEDVVESAMRRLTRSLAVESERQGARRWP